MPIARFAVLTGSVMLAAGVTVAALSIAGPGWFGLLAVPAAAAALAVRARR